MSYLVGQHQQTAFAGPTRGSSLDAVIVRQNDNGMATTYNAHDNDPTVHVQSDTTVPSVGVAGRIFWATGTNRLSYDTGTTWAALTIDASHITGGTLATGRLSGSYTGITGVGTVTAGTWNATAVGVAYGGTGLTATPTNGQLLIGNGTGFTLASLTAGTNITITPGAGTITIAAAGAGDVTGPASSTTNAIPRFSNTGGKVLVNSGVVVDASNNVSGVAELAAGSIFSTGTINISSAGAGQIQFPATQNPSANANTLDDYEEATFNIGGNGGVSLSGGGSYTKVGRAVHIRFTATWPTTSNTSQARVQGLPFTSSTTTALSVVTTSGSAVQALTDGSLVQLQDLSGTEYTNQNLSNQTVYVSGTYFV